MATKKLLATYEVGMKARKPYFLRADNLEFDYLSQVRFRLNGVLLLIIAPQKWDYIKVVPVLETESEIKNV